MKKFKVNVRVPVQVSWSQELVEDESNFYIRLTPRVMTGGDTGVPRLKRITVGNVTRYMTTRHHNYNQRALEEAMKKAVEMAKKDPEIKNAIIKGAQGKPAQAQTRGPFTPTVTLSPEDFAAGLGIGRSDSGGQMTTTGWSKKQLEEITKEEKEE